MSISSILKRIGTVLAVAALIASGCGGSATNNPSGGAAGTRGPAAGASGGAGANPSTGRGGAAAAAGGSASGGMAGNGGVSGNASGGSGGGAGLLGAGGTAGAGSGSAAGGGASAAGGAGSAAAAGRGGGSATGGQGGAGGAAGCPRDYESTGSGCSPPPPQLIAPMPGSAVGTSMPDLHFKFAKGFTSVYLDICGDRACSKILQSIAARGDLSGVATIGVGQTLPNGMIFWRGSTAKPGSTADVLMTPVWEFAVLARDRNWYRPFTWPQFADIEGDGFADLLVLSKSGGIVTVDEYPGSLSGLQNTPSSSSGALSGPSCPEPSLAGVGDIDGDGFGDVVIGDCQSLDVLTGGPSGFALPFSYRTALAGTFASLMVTGDINGDGYADVSGIARAGQDGVPQLWQFWGGPGGLTASPDGPISLPAGADDNSNVQVLGDINADGYADVGVADKTYGGGTGVVWVFEGAAAGFPSTPLTIAAPAGTYNFGSFPPSVGGTMSSDISGHGALSLLIGGTADAAASRGEVYVYSVLNEPPFFVPFLTLFPGGAGGLSSITGADVDGDGLGDVVVALGNEVAVFRSSADGLPSAPSDLLAAPNVGGATGNQLVRGVAALGDVNGDGRADFAAEIYVPGTSPLVVPVVYEGSTGPLLQVPARTLNGSQDVSLW